MSYNRKWLVLAYYPSHDRIVRKAFDNLTDAREEFRAIRADFRRMYGTDNTEATEREAGALVSFRIYTEDYTGTAYVEIVKI